MFLPGQRLFFFFGSLFVFLALVFIVFFVLLFVLFIALAFRRRSGIVRRLSSSTSITLNRSRLAGIDAAVQVGDARRVAIALSISSSAFSGRCGLRVLFSGRLRGRSSVSFFGNCARRNGILSFLAGKRTSSAS